MRKMLLAWSAAKNRPVEYNQNRKKRTPRRWLTGYAGDADFQLLRSGSNPDLIFYALMSAAPFRHAQSARASGS